MNRIILSVLLLVFSLVIKGQDKIITNNNRVIEAVVIEQTPRFVSYKWFDMDDSPLFTVKTRQLERIEYRNGVVDYLGSLNPRAQKPFSVNFEMLASVKGFMGDYFIVGFDYFVLPQVNLQINYGFGFEFEEDRFSFGGQYHFNQINSQSRLTPFAGVLYVSEDNKPYMQIPIGINYVLPSGLSLELSLSEQFALNTKSQGTLVGLSLGWRFGVKNF